VLVLLSLLLFADADAPKKPLVPPVITAGVNPSSAAIGDELVLRITVKHAEADAFEFPVDVSFGDFELAEAGRASAQRQEGPMLTEELVFKLACFETGEHEIPKISFRIGGEEFSTDALPVTIKSVISEEPTNAKDIQRESDGEPFAIYERVYWPFYAAASVLALLAGWIAWRRRGQRGQIDSAPEAKAIPAHEAALVLFRLLRDKNLLAEGGTREYYFEATEILRGYLSQRYAINALDLTTTELMQKLSAVSAPGLDREGMRTWLDHADLVKFAKLTPPIDQGAQMVDFFEQLVWATRPPAPKTVEAA
jgi:hypothetical protein